MTKRDYEAFARLLKYAREEVLFGGVSGGYQTLAYVREGLADILAADNPRFNRARFVEACGVGGPVGLTEKR